jgi:hypothetical protein
MAEEVSYSSSRMSDDDLNAIAAYLKSRTARTTVETPLASDDLRIVAGSAIYAAPSDRWRGRPPTRCLEDSPIPNFCSRAEDMIIHRVIAFALILDPDGYAARHPFINGLQSVGH